MSHAVLGREGITMTDGATPSANALPRSGPASSLRDRAVRGVVWTVGGTAVAMLLRFGSSLVLTRLLMPELFGLMAIVGVIFQGLLMFSDIGTGTAIIQNEHGDEEPFYNTAWTMQVIRGSVLWLCACILGYPAARLYGQPQLAWVLPVVGLSALIAGFNSTAIFRLNRHLHIGRVVSLELTTQALSTAGTITWAWFDKSIWALVVPALFGRAIYAVASHFLLADGRRNRFRWNPEARAALLRFGRWIFLSTLLTFLANQADRLIYGRMIPIGLLGVFGVAALYASLPMQLVQRMNVAVVFPALSRVVGSDRKRFGQVFRRVRTPLLMLAASAVALLMTAGPALMTMLYDARWHDAGWLLPLVAAGVWFQILEATNGSALLAHGRSQWVAASTGAKFATMLALIPLGYWLWGFPGAVIGASASDVARYVVSAAAVHRLGVRQMIGTDLLICLGIAATVALSAALGACLPATPYRPVCLVSASAALVALIWLPPVLWLWQRSRANLATR
jgi:O-antigen/teichoic acid export membrane protein